MSTEFVAMHGVTRAPRALNRIAISRKRLDVTSSILQMHVAQLHVAQA